MKDGIYLLILDVRKEKMVALAPHQWSVEDAAEQIAERAFCNADEVKILASAEIDILPIIPFYEPMAPL